MMKKLREAVEQYGRSKSRYRNYVSSHALRNEEAGDGVPLPTSLDSPGVWLLYVDVIRLKQNKDALEAALQRCQDAADYLVKLIQRDTPNIQDKDQWRTLVYPYEHYQNRIRVGFDGLQQPNVAMAFAQGLGQQVFDFAGGDFSTCYAEIINRSSGGHVEEAQFYFVK